jgi:hypothetical protein
VVIVIALIFPDEGSSEACHPLFEAAGELVGLLHFTPHALSESARRSNFAASIRPVVMVSVSVFGEAISEAGAV